MSQRKAKAFKSIEEILEAAMLDEKDAAQFYRDAADMTPDTDLKQFLLKLAEMEVGHFQSLEKKLEDCRAQNFCACAILASFDEI